MIIWIMGLSGSGKTTLAKLILKKYKKKLIHIDGDAIRNIYDKKIGHSQKDRQINAARISKLVKYLSDQKIDIVVSVLSNFPKWLKWNKKNLKDYFLVYLKTDKKILIKRKPNLYLKLKKNVVGKDIKFNEPIKPNYTINNCEGINSLKKEVIKILNLTNK
tara:strand:- start:39 stop:521 length:483 start_codon:yes stop_codon:yes gene_type:complete